MYFWYQPIFLRDVHPVLRHIITPLRKLYVFQYTLVLLMAYCNPDFQFVFSTFIGFSLCDGLDFPVFTRYVDRDSSTNLQYTCLVQPTVACDLSL